MSEIYNNLNQQILGGSIQFAVNIPAAGSCEFCNIYISSGGYDFMNKLVCSRCREKLLKRINLIMNFE
jgi:hypothetical protein